MIQRLALRLLLVAFASSLALLQPARAQLDWHWQYDETEFNVYQSESIFIHATVFNEPTSTQNLTGPVQFASYTGDLQAQYRFNYDPEFTNSLRDLNLAPGESFSFPWGALHPIAAIPGTFVTDPAILKLADMEKAPANQFVLHVRPGEPPSPVPEPSTAVAVALLLAATLAARPGAGPRGNACRRVASIRL